MPFKFIKMKKPMEVGEQLKNSGNETMNEFVLRRNVEREVLRAMRRKKPRRRRIGDGSSAYAADSVTRAKEKDV